MKNFFLRAEASGELSRPLQSILGLLAIALAALCYFVVYRALPMSSAVAQLALASLLLAAPAGFLVLFGFVVKVWQGSRVEIANREH